MNETYLECRDLGHSWRAYTVEEQGRGKRRVYTRILRCPRCETYKYTDLDYQGYILKSVYEYTKEYHESSVGRLTKAVRATLRIRDLS